jgi:alpha-tubulin suppressor-like RCC1 family protein
VQVGTNRNWKAITTVGASAHVLALRGDGTLWMWGSTNYYSIGAWFSTTNPFPTQFCRESNWVALGEGPRNGARNQAGELWSSFPLARAPGADVPVGAIGSLISTNGAVSAFGRLFDTNWTEATYETRPDGTLWATPNSWPPINPPFSAPVRVGRRSDWVSVWASAKTMIGLTSDGTLWAWGLDYGQTSHMGVGEKLGMLRESIAHELGGTPWRTSLNYDWEGFQAQKEPRPLFRLVATNAPAAHPPQR